MDAASANGTASARRRRGKGVRESMSHVERRMVFESGGIRLILNCGSKRQARALEVAAERGITLSVWAGHVEFRDQDAQVYRKMEKLSEDPEGL